MKYTVIWLPAAEAEVARLWNDAPVRRLIAAAVDSIDDALRRHPLHVGESREGNRRILLVWPLAVNYFVRGADRIVEVREVWRFDR